LETDSPEVVADGRSWWRRERRSNVESVIGQSPASKAVNMEAEEVVTRQQAKIQQTEDLVRAVMNCKVCELAIASELLVVTICKSPIDPITNPSPVYSHSIA
jgi:hypothetical protein